MSSVSGNRGTYFVYFYIFLVERECVYHMELILLFLIVCMLRPLFAPIGAIDWDGISLREKK